MTLFRSHGQSLSAIVDGTTEHLVPHEFHVGRVLSLDEAAQVMLDDVTGWLAPNGHTYVYIVINCRTFLNMLLNSAD